METLTTINPTENILSSIQNYRGLLWEKIEQFIKTFQGVEGVAKHNTEQMQAEFPLKHTFENGFYTREIFMPKGSLVVSFIHTQDHPSFFMSGEMSLVMDTGEVKRIKAPLTVHTKVGTQRVAYMHEDCTWVCVYKTDKTTVEEAEKEIYTDNFRELPTEFLENHKKELLCQG